VTTAHLITAFESIIELLALWVLVCVFWKDYCLDAFRQNLFTLRDDLFLYAANGNISFDHPAYRLLRERLNGAIRYGHEFTLTRVVVALVTMPPNASESESDAWEINTATLSKEKRAVLSQYRNAFAFNVIKYVVLRSFFWAVLVLCGKAINKTKDAMKRRGTARVVAAVERVETETIEYSHDHEEPGAVPVGV